MKKKRSSAAASRAQPRPCGPCGPCGVEGAPPDCAAAASPSDRCAAAAANETQSDAQQTQSDAAREHTVKFLLGECACELTPQQAKNVEVGVFNWALDVASQRRVARNWNNPHFRSLYESKARSVCANLAKTSYVGNERLLDRIACGEFLPHELAVMHADHVFPERWHKVVEAKVRRDEYLSTAKPAAMTDQFRCGRCKKRECSFMELQTRSCDEPATLFIQCLLCGHRWRVG
jgi:DNA-directed RNA polymerase subunit M/transcription elongation factor TFIIS